MRRVALCVLAVLLTALAQGKRPKWHELEGYTFEQYKKDFNKPYKTTDASHAVRQANFEENLKHIRDLNSCSKRTWRAGVNEFTDMSRKEFKAFNKFRKGDPSLRQNFKVVHQAPASGEQLPLTVDWRLAEPRVLTAVKHQGSCGSCWAHSAAESIESQYALLTGMLPVLSVGQINSCTPNVPPYNSAGCDGGDYGGAWAYLANTSISRPDIQKTVTENWAYPIPLGDWFFDSQPANYTTSACRDVSTEWQTPTNAWFAYLTAAGVSGVGSVNSNSATGGPAAMKALRDVGPQSISVAAGNWQWYESGIMNNTNTSGEINEWQVDHAVQLVGYGFDKYIGENYWVVRNSWATLWGEDGFIRLWRAKDGQPEPCGGMDVNGELVCGTSGLLSDLQYPLVYEGKPTHFG